MIALIPTQHDLDRLALNDFEPPEELHLTLFYLGDADDITPTQVNELVTNLIQLFANEYTNEPVLAKAFGVAHWNPESEYPAWVLNVGDEKPAEDGDTPRERTDGLADVRHLVEHALADLRIDYPPQHSPWQPHICIAYSKDDLYGELASRLGPLTFDVLRVAWGEYDIDIPLVSEPIIAAGEKFHLPGRHNQKSHGNRKGKSRATNRESGPDEIRERNGNAPAADPVTPAAERSYESRVDDAARDADVFTSLTYPDRSSLLDAYGESRAEDDPTVDQANASVTQYQGGAYYDINDALRNDDVDRLPPATQGFIDGLDALMATNKTESNVVVYRGITRADRVFGPAWSQDGDNAGLEWTDNAFVSTTAKSDLTQRFISSSPLSNSVKMRVLVPAGTSVVVPDRENAWDRTESEVLLNRGSRFRIVRDYVDDTGARSLDVEVVR